MKIFITASCCAFIFSGALSAQQSLLDKFTFNVGGGISETALSTSKNLVMGWNGQGGVGYNFTPHLGLMVEIEYDKFRITNSALNSLGSPAGYPGGTVKNKAVTLEPIWHFHPKGSWDVYAFGGGGTFQRVQQLTRPTVATETGTNSYFGFNTPGYPASETNVDYTVYKPGLDAGAGVSLKVKWHLKLYLEGRYNHVFMGSLGHMDYAPISLGVRW